LRNGHISAEEAMTKRATLQQESQFFGAMDGAMRFVKGDSIAGLISVAVNLIGGLSIGIFQRGMSFSDAASLYSLLSVGDGLVSQIPSMLMAVAAGTVVTRVSGEGNGSLGIDIGRQLSRDPRTLGIASAMTVAMGFVPGFPIQVLWPLGILLAIGAFLRVQAVRAEVEALLGNDEWETGLQPGIVPSEAGDAPFKPVDRSKFGDPIVAYVSFDTFHFLDQSNFATLLDAHIRALAQRVGMAVTIPTFTANPELPDNIIHMQVENAPAGLIQLTEEAGLDGAAAQRTNVVRDYVGVTFSVEDLNQWLTSLEARLGKLARDVRDTVPQMLSVAVVRLLLNSGVNLSQPRGFLETMLGHEMFGDDPRLLADQVRRALGPQVVFGLLTREGKLIAIPLGSKWENAVLRLENSFSRESELAVNEEVDELVKELRQRIAEAGAQGNELVGIVDETVRSLSQQLLVRFGFRLPLLSPEEISDDITCDLLPTLGEQEMQSAEEDGK
jgi:type III secretion protein V